MTIYIASTTNAAIYWVNWGRNRLYSLYLTVTLNHFQILYRQKKTTTLVFELSSKDMKNQLTSDKRVSGVNWNKYLCIKIGGNYQSTLFLPTIHEIYSKEENREENFLNLSMLLEMGIGLIQSNLFSPIEEKCRCTSRRCLWVAKRRRRNCTQWNAFIHRNPQSSGKICGNDFYSTSENSNKIL